MTHSSTRRSFLERVGLAAAIALLVAGSGAVPGRAQSTPPPFPGSPSGGGQIVARGGAVVTADMLAAIILAGPGPEVDDEGDDLVPPPRPQARPDPAPALPVPDWQRSGDAGSKLALAQTPKPTTSWLAALPKKGGYPADAQISVSTTHVVVTNRQKIAYYDKAGTPLGEIDPLKFYAPLGLDDGTEDAILRYNDLRTIYDSYRNRFWVLAGGGNIKQPDPAKGHGIWAVAVSIDQNPLDGWYLYWWDVAAHWGVPNDPVYQPGDVGDYPSIGIDSFGFHETNVVRNQISNAFRYYHVVFFPADQMAAGNAGPIGGWQYWDLTNTDGSPVGLVQPVVHHGPTSRAYYVSRYLADEVVVWALTDPLQPTQELVGEEVVIPSGFNSPPDGPQLGSMDLIKMSLFAIGISTNVLKVVYRSGYLYVAISDARDWFGEGSDHMLASNHLVRLFVLGFPSIPTTPNTGFVDRVFGQSSIDDPEGAHVSYGWPAVEVNKNRDMVVAYSRSADFLYPEVRYSAYFENEPDIRPSRLLKAGEAAFGGQPGTGTTQPWGDTTGVSVDPKDDTAIWMAQQYANANGDYDVWVGKVFGIQYTDWHVIGFPLLLNTSVAPGGPFAVAATVGNQGDRAAPPIPVYVYLDRDAQPPILAGRYELSALRPGQRTSVTLSAVVPRDTEPGIYTVSVEIDPRDRVDEYGEENNTAIASGRLLVRGR